MKYPSLLCLLFVSSILYSQTETCQQNVNDPDLRTITQSVGSESISREYIMHIPQDYDGNTPAPLVINLHGFGDCASDYAESIGDSYGFDVLADDEGIIVIYPQGAYRPEKDDTYWEPGDTGFDNIYDNDIYFIETLIDEVGSEFAIDTNRIYACGYSNGGMMAYSLACNRSDLFAAIGIMSGTMLEEDCTLDEPVPIIKFHGIADGVLPYDGGIWYQSVAEVISFWLDKNNIPASSLVATELNEGKVRRDNYGGDDDNTCLNLYTIFEEYDKPGDHVWFSDLIDGQHPNRIMWDFFEGNCSIVNSTTEDDKIKIALSPNPAQNHLNVENAQNQSFLIYDVHGRLCLSGIILTNSQDLNIETLQEGYYVIRIGNWTERFIKLSE